MVPYFHMCFILDFLTITLKYYLHPIILFSFNQSFKSFVVTNVSVLAKINDHFRNFIIKIESPPRYDRRNTFYLCKGNYINFN